MRRSSGRRAVPRLGGQDPRGLGLSRRQLLIGAGALGGGILLSGCGDDSTSPTTGSTSAGTSGSDLPSLEGVELSFLCWPGHGDNFLVGPFQEATGARVRVKEYQDGEEALALYTTSAPGTYDLIMTEPTDLTRFIQASGFEPLDPADFPAADTDFLDHYKPSTQDFRHLAGWEDDEYYAVPWSFAVSSMSINTEMVSPEEAESYAFLWEPKFDQRVGWSHYWLNAMSTMSQYYGVSQNWWEPFNYTPLQLTDPQWQEFRDWMFSAPKTVRGFYGVGDSTQALAQGETWAMPGAGFPTSGSLQIEGEPFASVVPAEGSPMYTESLSIGVGSKNVEAAKEFIRYAISPEGCARKALLPAYQGVPVSLESWKWIADNEPQWVPVMDIDLDGPNLLDHWNAGVLSPRVLPENVDEWVATYEEFKNSVA